MIAIPLRTALFGLTIALTTVSPLTAMGQANPGLGAIQPTQTQEQQQGVVINGVVVTPHQLKQLGVQAGQGFAHDTHAREAGGIHEYVSAVVHDLSLRNRTMGSPRAARRSNPF